MAKGKKAASKKVGAKKAPEMKEEPIVEPTADPVTEEVVEETVEETVEENTTEDQEEEVDQEEEEAEEEAEDEAEEEEEEEEVEDEAANEVDITETTASEGEAKPKREPKPNNYVTTHPEEFSNQIMRDLKNDFRQANNRQNFNNRKNNNKDHARIRQKRSQLNLDTILVYGDREHRNCSSVALMSFSFMLRECIQKYRKAIGMGKRSDVCPEKLHHTIIKVDSDLGLAGLRSVIKWMHTGDLNLTAENFEEIVAVVLFFRIKMLRQSLVKLGRKVGIKFVPVPANEKTIERRKKQGKQDLPNGFEESEKLEEGEEPLPDDAKVVEGKDILAKIKNVAKLEYLQEIPKSAQQLKKEEEKQKREAKKQNNNSRKRNHTDNKNSGSGDVKKSKFNENAVKQENSDNKDRRNNRGQSNSTRVKRESTGKSIYRQQPLGQPTYQPPQPNYYQPQYQQPPAYGYAPPAAPQYPQQAQYQQPYQNQQYRPAQNGQPGYYGGYGR